MCRNLIDAMFVWLVLVGPCAAVVSAKQDNWLIDTFDEGQNSVGGQRSAFQNAPSRATAVRSPQSRWGLKGSGLQITAHRAEEGYCGAWIHFFDAGAASLKYLDASSYQYLSFWVKGAKGGERFTVKLADASWVLKEDSVAVGEIDKFLEEGVTRRWQQVRIPLSESLELDFTRLAGLTLDFDQPGRFTVCIDNITLESDRAARNRGRAGASPLMARDADSRGPVERAVWLWDIQAMLETGPQVETFLAFCRQAGITQVWAQLPYEMQVQDRQVQRDAGGAAANRCVLERTDELCRFLAQAHQAGLQVHALEGYPEYAQREHHHVPLAIVDAVLAFNREQSTAEQFDGIHFDIEPYLLVGWHDPRRREQILYEFLTLCAECQRRVRTASPRIEFGVDVPFWWHAIGEDGQTIGAVPWQGVRQAASFHLLEMLDNVGVMNYRDMASGVDGLVTHARGLLEHAEVAAVARVFVGVETAACQGAAVLFAVGLPRAEFERRIRCDASEIVALSRLDGYRLRVMDDGDHVHVGLEVREANSAADRIRIAEAISRVALDFGLGQELDPPSASALQLRLVDKLAGQSGWSGARDCSVRDPRSGRVHLLVKVDGIEPNKITFADENAGHFLMQTGLAEAEFTKHACYAGMAVHHYESFRQLLRPDPPTKQSAATLTSAR
jgi:hypothetical protein